MESSSAGIGRLDCYEDMFKEITRKLYGEDPDHRTSSVQNEFEASVAYKSEPYKSEPYKTDSYKPEEDNENGTDGSDDGNWTLDDEPLKGTDGSRIAAYHAGKATWRCYECGDCMGGGPRDVAEHFVELHSTRIIAEDSRARHHSPRKDYLQSDLKLEEVVCYLERVRDRAERVAPPSRRTQETQTVPAALIPATSTFLLQELPTTPPQQLHQNSTVMPATATTPASGKRYTCLYCPYGTDRRDLYTRHENIHREEKPFHCYVCYKPFSRADHVKKHFLRMHREHTYELSRIRRPAGTAVTPKAEPGTAAAGNGNNSQHTNYPSGYNNNKGYQMQPNSSTGNNSGTLYQTTNMSPTGVIPETNCGNRRVQNGGCNSKSHLKGGSKGAQERRYTCCYCSWSGVDNWCLKRHLNTHLKPFACALCEYKAARAERLATHVLKVHNRRQCSRCPFLAEDATQLQVHQLHVHRVSNTNPPASTTSGQSSPQQQQQQQSPNRQQPQQQPQLQQQPQQQQQQPMHPIGAGRPPPGPPVFPASSPSIATATAVLPTSTILGATVVAATRCIHNGRSDEEDRDTTNSSSDHEMSSCDGSSERRSRKQSAPRKVMSASRHLAKSETSSQLIMTKPIKNDHGNSALNERLKLSDKELKGTARPRGSTTRAGHYRPYPNIDPLILQKLWRQHRLKVQEVKENENSNFPDIMNEITLKATVFTNPHFNYQR